jgi:hypothetical protein
MSFSFVGQTLLFTSIVIVLAAKKIQWHCGSSIPLRQKKKKELLSFSVFSLFAFASSL